MPGIEWILLYMVLGALVGFMVGLLGLGGGGILIPLLASIFTYQGVSIDNGVHLALGTSLTCMIISSTASIRAHSSRDAVDWQVVRGLALGIILGAFLATQVAANVNSVYIALFFALFMALVAGQVFVNCSHKPLSFRGLIVAGIGIGSVSALATVGGGFLTITYLGYKNVDIKKAIGTSAAIGFPIAITGTVGYMVSGWSKTLGHSYTLGSIDVPAFLAISIAGFIAAPYGAGCSHRLPDAYLKRIFAIISLILIIKMLVSLV